MDDLFDLELGLLTRTVPLLRRLGLLALLALAGRALLTLVLEDLLAPLFDLALQRSDLQAELRGGLALGLGHLLVQRAESGHEPLVLAEQRHRHDAQPLEALLAGDAVSVGHIA
ncbi:MAG: hypothetical protein U0359_24175 [Byssovorax sp.]